MSIERLMTMIAYGITPARPDGWSVGRWNAAKKMAKKAFEFIPK